MKPIFTIFSHGDTFCHFGDKVCHAIT